MTPPVGASAHRAEEAEADFPTVLDVLKDIFRELEGDGDMSLKVMKAATLKSEGKSMLIYSHSGTGKTWTLGSLPPSKTLILDVDKGIETISESDHDVVRPEGAEEILEICRRLEAGELKYRFVGVDSLSELEKLLQVERKRLKKREFLSLREYGESSEILRELVRRFCALRSHGITVVFTCLETLLDIQLSDDQIVSKSLPLLSKKLTLEVCGLMDLVCRLTINPSTGGRELHFAGSNDFIAKTRVHAVDPVEPPDLTALFRKVYGIKAPADEQKTKEDTPSKNAPTKDKPKAETKNTKKNPEPSTK